MHPIFSALLTRPELAVEHAAGYAELAGDEAKSMGKAVAGRVAALAGAAAFGLVFLTLAGVAAMLGSALGTFHWTMAAVPGAALAGALACGFLASRPLRQRPFESISTQLRADASALREMGDAR